MKLKKISALALLGAGLLIGQSVNAQWTHAGNKTWATSVNDSIGIGTTNPIQKVDIVGTGITNMSVRSSGSSANVLVDRKGVTNNANVAYRTNKINNWLQGMTGNSNFGIKNYVLNSYAILCNFTNNRVGINNVTNPRFALCVDGGTKVDDTAAVDVVVKRTDAFDAIGVRATSQPAPGFGIGVQGLGNFAGVVGIGDWGVYGLGVSVGTFSESAGFADTTTATGNEADGSNNIAGPSNFGIGAYVQSNASRFNYGIFSVCGPTGTPSDSDNTHSNWAGYFLGDIVSSRSFKFSDAKLKNNIQPITNALEKLNKLQTATYTFKQSEFPDLSLPSGNQIGFIAENMQTVFPELVKDATSPRIKGIKGKTARNSVAFKAVNYEGIIPVLVAAIKEQKQITDQKDEAISAKITQLEKENAELKSRLDAIEKSLTQSGLIITPSNKKSGSNSADAARLEQNNPNPFNQQSIIKYYVPANFHTAQLVITDMNGGQLKSINISHSGFGQVTVNRNELAIGSYLYSLVIDGAKADSKTMVLTK